MTSNEISARSKTFAIIGIILGVLAVWGILSQGGPRGKGFYLLGQWHALVIGILMVVSGIATWNVRRPAVRSSNAQGEAPRAGSRKRRTFLVALAADIGMIAWMTFTMWQIQSRRENLRGITPMFSMRDHSHGQPSWQRDFVGDDAAAYAEGANFSLVRLTDVDMPRVAKLTQVKSLLISNQNITDSGLAALRSMPELDSLALDGTHVTDVGMSYLAELPQLQRLDLRGTQITDAGIRKLGELTMLRMLRIGETNVTDAGLEHIGKLVDLEELDLNGTAISDAGIQHLNALRNLRELKLQAVNLTDVGLASLANLTSLKKVELQGTKITDDGLRHMHGWQALRMLYLPQRISSDAERKLDDKLPNAVISRTSVERRLWK